MAANGAGIASIEVISQETPTRWAVPRRPARSIP